MPPAHVVLILCLMAALGVASAFFSAMETSLFSLGPPDIKKLRELLPDRQATIDLLVTNPRRLLSMILVGDTLSNLPLCLLGFYLLRTFSTWHTPGENPGAARAPILPAAFGLYLLVVGMCDLLPKVAALRAPLRVAPPSIRALHYLRPVLDPLCGALQTLSERLADLLTPRQVSQPLQLTEEDFEALVEVGAEEGALRDAESEMIQEIIKLGDKTAKDCMTPRVEIFGLPDDLTNAEAIARLRAQRRRRVPVYGDTPDEILGVLDTQKFLSLCARPENPPDADPAPPYTEVMDPPSYVSESMRALDLLRSFVNRPQGLAVVVDEYGGTEGIVTLADITEEIVGDALPREQDELYIQPLDDDRLLAGGHARLDDLSEYPGFELHAEGLDTISGLVFNRLGYLPKPGDVVRLRNLTLTIRRVTRKRITEVMIERNTAHEGGTVAEEREDENAEIVS